MNYFNKAILIFMVCSASSYAMDQHKSDAEVEPAGQISIDVVGAQAAADHHQLAQVQSAFNEPQFPRMIRRRASDPENYCFYDSINQGHYYEDDIPGSPLSNEDDNIFFAAKRGDLAVVMEELEENPELINAVDEYGNTMLHYAIDGNQEEVAAYLLKAQADVDAPNEHQRTPLIAAVLNNNPRLVIQVLARKTILRDEDHAALEMAQTGFDHDYISRRNETDEEAIKNNSTIQSLLTNYMKSHISNELQAALKRVSPEHKQAASPIHDSDDTVQKLTVEERNALNRQRRALRKHVQGMRRQKEAAQTHSKDHAENILALSAITQTEVSIAQFTGKKMGKKTGKAKTLSSLERARKKAAEEREKKMAQKEKERAEIEAQRKAQAQEKKRLSPNGCTLSTKKDLMLLRPIVAPAAPRIVATQQPQAIRPPAPCVINASAGDEAAENPLVRLQQMPMPAQAPEIARPLQAPQLAMPANLDQNNIEQFPGRPYKRLPIFIALAQNN